MLSSRSLAARSVPRPTTTLIKPQVQRHAALLVKAATAVGDYKEAKKELKKEAKEAKALLKQEHKADEKKTKAEDKEKKEAKMEMKEKSKDEKKKSKDEKKKMEPESKMEHKALKEERKRLVKEAEARGALYALHWCVAPKKVAQDAATTVATVTGGTGDPTATKQFISSLQMDLKRMEKVAEDAVWYLTKEAADGLHVVLVTANAKDASKYELEELPAGAATHVLSLGAAGEVEVPVATLHSMVMTQKEKEDSSDSDSESESDSGSSSEEEGKGDSSKAAILPPHGQMLGSIHNAGDVDAAIAAALASANALGESNELDSGAPAQYPPFRSFL